jgi:hypothetical protein
VQHYPFRLLKLLHCVDNDDDDDDDSNGGGVQDDDDDDDNNLTVLCCLLQLCGALYATFLYPSTYTRWFKYDQDDLCVNKSQFVPVIFEPPCTMIKQMITSMGTGKMPRWCTTLAFCQN